ncbi:MAG TPA: hypothetical protein VK789_28360 [Bryobacteraceae bacterium]|nr:hypothetical protein [Bryobacteraceae bacterium]
MNVTRRNPRMGEAGHRAMLKERLLDYDLEDTLKLRERLIERWRAAHPAAACQQSSYLRPLIKDEQWERQTPEDPDEGWYNDIYYVTLRRRPDKVFETKQGMIQLGIASHDGSARHDWRDYQAIKNQLAGPECEGFELFPAESRLLDPSNYYTLWCFPGVKRIHVGRYDTRYVLDAHEAFAPQRAMAVKPEE